MMRHLEGRSLPLPRHGTRLALLAGTVLAMLLAPAAQAAGPSHAKVGPYSYAFDAGVLCDFAITWDAVVTSDNQLVFPVQDNGDQLIRIVGRELLVLTNVDSGASIQVNTGFRQDLTFHADGSLDVSIDGTIVAGYFPTDIGGPSWWFFKGHLNDAVDPTFTAVGHTFVGQATDLCAALG